MAHRTKGRDVLKRAGNQHRAGGTEEQTSYDAKGKRLQLRWAQRIVEREILRNATRHHLLCVLPFFFGGKIVFLFGSLTVAGAFHRNSDVDLAVEILSVGMTLYGLIA